MELIKDQKNNSRQPLLKHIIPFRFDQSEDSNFMVEKEITSILKAYEARDSYQELNMSESELFTHLLDQIHFNASQASTRTVSKEAKRNPLTDSLTEKEKPEDCKDTSGEEQIIGSHIARDLKQIYFEFDPDNPMYTNNDVLQETLKRAKVSLSDYQLFLFKSGIGFLILSLELEGLEKAEEFIELNCYLKSINRLNERSGAKVCCKVTETIILQQEDYRLQEEPGFNSHSHTVAGKKQKLWLKNDPDAVNNDNSQKDIKIIYRDKDNRYELILNDTKKSLYGDFILSLLEPVGGINFFNDFIMEKTTGDKQESCRYPAKALIMSSVIIHKAQEDSEQELLKNLLRSSRGYNLKYELKVKESPEQLSGEKYGIYLPFDNVYWAFSREGIGNMIIDEADHKASDFLVTDFSQRLNRSYLVLYILSLHQYYGLIHLSDLASRLPYDVNCYADVDNSRCNQNYEKLKQLREKVYFFHLKCVFEEVSYITHQEVFYRGIRNVLGIRNMIEELDFEMKKVSEIAALIREEEYAKLENERKQRELERNLLEMKRQEDEAQERKLEEKREQDKKLLMDMMASGGGIVGFFILYDNVAKMVIYLKLVENLHMNWFKQAELNQFLLTLMIIAALFVIGLIAFKVKKASSQKH